MCVYCMIGDHHWKHDPPWDKPKTPDPMYPWHPLVPAPLTPGPHQPWPLDRLKEFENLLRRVRDIEDKLGCPCEPNKADYLALLRQRIEALEAKVKKRKRAIKANLPTKKARKAKRK